MSTRFNQKRGFTIVELLVVIGIMALLLAVLLPALGGVRRRSLKADEINSIRQVGVAWNLYANSNQDNCLPGYLEPEVQAEDSWNVRYEYNNGEEVPPADAAPWTWRLMPFFDDSHDIVHGHLDEPGVDVVNLWEESEEIAFEPAFGYNALYFGGWWEPWDPGNADTLFPKGKPRYSNYINEDGASLSVVVRSVARIRRSTDVVIFCSSAEVEPGVYKRWPDNQVGSHLIVPPFVCQDAMWGWPTGPGGGIQGVQTGTTASGGAGDFWTVEAFETTAVPVGRYTKSAAVLFADLHTKSESTGALLDMRMWIDEATSSEYRHECD